MESPPLGTSGFHHRSASVSLFASVTMTAAICVVHAIGSEASSGSSSVRDSSAQFSNGLCATAVMKVQSSVSFACLFVLHYQKEEADKQVPFRCMA